jgi:outer membrane protein OmpA-like peptidoglycan-associated protein
MHARTMKSTPPTLRRSALAVALGLDFLPAYGQEDETGKRVDNARVDLHPVPPPAELQPGLAYPLPSGVTRAEAEAMRAAALQLPAAPPAQASTVLTDTLAGDALFASGSAELTPVAQAALRDFAARFAGKPGLRFAVTGHTDDQRLSARSRRIFGDNQGLSEARALAVAAFLKGIWQVPADAAAIAGHGATRPVAGNGTPEGMARNRRVEVAVWHEEAAPAAVPPAPTFAPLPCEPVAAEAPAAPFRVTVDGEAMLNGGAMDGVPTLEADRQRCVDVALERADIQVRYDSLAIVPALNVWAVPNGVVRGETAEFRAWSNYAPWIAKAELRLFRPGQKPQETPLAVLPAGWAGPTLWRVPADMADEQVFFLLRVHDAEGRFDETALKPLTLLTHSRPVGDEESPERERLTGHGENSLALRNIPVSGGTVTVNGKGLVAGERVDTLGLSLPVDAHGRFAVKQILPAGPHTVEVKVTDADGKASVYRRNLSIPKDDWFYVALADLTIGDNKVSGPARLVTGDDQHYEDKIYIDGRTAFYLKGKIKGEWLLTAAADTGEQPIEDLFSNFSSKDPRYLLRNINPDLYYPVYGDDSTTVDDAPTQGKFYVRLEKGDSHVMWGNFQTSWSGSELMQFSRGLYGAKLRWRSEDATRWGEKRTQVDAFAADPGTVGSREEFRGTGGSLYYLRRMDVTRGSERLWVEVRDRDSGLVVERKPLTPAQDYEIDYLQGRVMLREPLPSTGGDGGLVLGSAVGGNPLYLVATYEYAPGLDAIDNFTTGLRASHWVGDHVQLGLTGYHQGERGADQALQGLDATFRLTPGSYVKLEGARSSGTGGTAFNSIDGGYGFAGQTAGGQGANAYRVEAGLDLADVSEAAQGRVSAYVQDRERGFSGPGQIVAGNEELHQYGVKAEVQATDATRVEVKADARDGEAQDAENLEAAVRHRFHPEWEGAVGLRRDARRNRIANASPILSQDGARTDAHLRLHYLPDRPDGRPGEKDDWDVYGFAQGTLDRDGAREKNDRVGLGGGWRINDRVKLYAELSDGTQGAGGRVGTDYRLSDRSNAYLAYQVETENPDYAYRGRHGSFVSGSSTRVSDALRLFGETRMSHGAGPESLTHAFGLDWAPNDLWTWGGKVEAGTVSDTQGGDIERKAAGVTLSYKREGVKYSGGLEWRRDDSRMVGAPDSSRTTWLLKNAVGVQYTREWRLLGKLNLARSSNSQGAFQDGNFHEVVLGAAYRPVDNDRWNTLVKYTNLHNVPSPGQVGLSGAAADYAQRSQVFAIDTIYDLKPWLSVGGKYAVRVGELKTQKVGGEWFSSTADLIVLRADWHFVKEWDALVEARRLRATEAMDARAGMLLAVYRHLGEGLKAGIGYNFTNYSDDLTDLSYRSRGWFINVLGTI